MTDSEPKREIETTVPIPFVQIAKDLSQGYGFSFPLEGRIAKKYKVLKRTFGGVEFEVTLTDHDLMTGEAPGFTLLIFRTLKSDPKQLDSFSIMGKREGVPGSGSFSVGEIRQPFHTSASEFWKEYEEAQVDREGNARSMEIDRKNRDATLDLNPPAIHLSLGTPSK